MAGLGPQNITVNTLSGGIMDSLLDPPDVFEEGKPHWRERHNQVLNYARALFAVLASDETLANAHHNATTFASFYTGSENPQPDKYDLELTSINLINAAVNVKEAKFLTDRLEMHYTSDKNSDHMMSKAVSRLFDWHALRTYRDKLKAKVEKNAMIFGTEGVLILPKKIYKGDREVLIPAYPERIDFRKMYFDPFEDGEEDYTMFAIRDVMNGDLLDQEYKDLLKKRGVESFARGPVSTMGEAGTVYGVYGETLYTDERKDLLTLIGLSDVEVLRVWKQDKTKVKKDFYYPLINPDTNKIDAMTDNEERQASRFQADKEFEPIIMESHLPAMGENHYNHLLVHLVQRENLAKAIDDPEANTTPEMLENMDMHIEMTEKFLDDGDQIPDKKNEEVNKFRGGWRFIKIIGDQVVSDGDLDLLYEKLPIVMFRNSLDPNTSIGLSDVSTLVNLQVALNSLVCDLLMNSHDNAHPSPRKPARLKGEETVKDGETIYVDPELDQDWMYQPIQPAALPSQIISAIQLVHSFQEIISGGNATVRGEPGQVRSSGVETAEKLAIANRRFSSSEILFGHAWERFAEITLGQIVQYMRDEEIVAVIGPDYQDVVPILIKAIDPYSSIKVIRVPKDADIENQTGQVLQQLALTSINALATPPQAILDILGGHPDGGVVSRFYGELKRYLENPEMQKQWGELLAAREQASQKKSK